MNLRIIAVAVLGLMFGCIASANVCTPITISTAPTTHDDGNGPVWNLGVGGNNFGLSYYAPGAVINTYGTEYIFEIGNLPGWANVYAGFNGCNQDWTLWVEGTYKIYDNTLKEYVAQGGNFYYQVPKDCGVVISCQYNGLGTTSGNFWVTKGHQYYVEFFIWASTNVGQSPTYMRSVTVNVN